MQIVCGIGNIGKDYEATRHNCGFMVCEALATAAGIGFTTNKKWKADVAQWSAPGGGKVLLIKPRTYVNGSGVSVQGAMTFYKVLPEQVLVVVDDINLKLGDLRLRPEGSHGGHNGLRDIEQRIGRGYARLRMGIGSPTHAGAQVDHVLGRFFEDEQADAAAMVAKAADCVRAWIADGCTAAMGRFNGPLRPPPPRNAGRPATAADEEKAEKEDGDREL